MGKVGRIAIGSVGVLVALLALCQAVLPSLAASRISSRVGRYGSVASVSVSAWPAVELLWGHAGSVRVRAKRLSLSAAQAASLLWEGRGMASMDLSAESLQLGSLHVTGASFQKRGSALHAQAHASEADVRNALPAGVVGMRLLRSERGQVEVQATGSLFGVRASMDAVALASNGKLVARPQGFLVSGLHLTLFSDPHVWVQGVGASAYGDGPTSYVLSMDARLR
jgi:hypothetical protein